MCQKCVRKSKRLGIPKTRTFGQIKALANSFYKYGIVGMYDKKTNVAVEAHLCRILQATTKRRRSDIYD